MRYFAALATIAGFLFTGAAAKADISICNDFRTRIRVALAYQNQRDVPASGWWSVEPNVCQPVGFAFQGSTIYYAADSDAYTDGAATKRDHWGNKLKLFVSDSKFDLSDAQGPRSGAAAKMFSSYEIPPQYMGKPMSIRFNFISGNTNITITGPK